MTYLSVIMVPSRKEYPSAEEINLQHTSTTPLPPPIIYETSSSPPIAQRQTTTTAVSSYQPISYPSYGYSYPYQNYGYNGYPPGCTNPMLTAASPDSVFHGFQIAGQSAFDSVQSVVQTLSSCSMMLQSTLFAIQNSVSAVTNVAQHFTNLRGSFIESCTNLIRMVKYYLRKLSYILMLRSVGKEGASMPNIAQFEEHKERHLFVFLAVVVGTPYLLWKLLRSILSSNIEANNWKKGISEHFLAEVQFPYKAVNKDELSVTKGDNIRIAPKHKQPAIKGWILASKDEVSGLVPANYVKIVSKFEEKTHPKPKLKELKEAFKGAENE